MSVEVASPFARTPFAPGSISLGLHPVSRLPAPEQVEDLTSQARAAEAAGFDGVTISEHHAGFPSYLPQPLLVCNWLLAATRDVWCAPCPILLGLRNPVLLAEELAWTAACHPGRVGIACAPGYAASDFDVVGEDFAARLPAFEARITRFVGLLGGEGPLAADPAVAAWTNHPRPILLASNSVGAADRAARLGLGIVTPGGSDAPRIRRLVDRYRASGGDGPACCICSVWVGDAPEAAAAAALAARYRAAAATGMSQAAGFTQSRFTGPIRQVVDELARFTEAAGVDGLNLRVHVADADPAETLAQIGTIGAEVLPALRAALP